MAAPQLVGAESTGVNQGPDSEVVVEAPNGVSSGDYQLVVVSMVTDSADFEATPSGWTLLTNTVTFLDGGEDFRTAIYESYTDTGTFTLTRTGERVWNAIRMAWSLPEGSSGRTVAIQENSTELSTSHQVPSVTTAEPDSVIVGLGSTETIDDPLSWTGTGSMTEIARQDAVNSVERLWLVAGETGRATPGGGSPGTFTTDVSWQAQMFAVVIDGSGGGDPGGDPPIVDAGEDVVDWPVGDTYERMGTYDLNGGTLDEGGWSVIDEDGEVIATNDTEGVTFAPSRVGTWTLEFHITTNYGTSTDSFTLTSVEDDPGGEGPAYVVSRTTGESTTDTLDHLVTMPSGINQGDLILVAFTHDNATAVPSAPSPWYNGPASSEWLQVNGSSTNLGGAIFTYEDAPAGGPGDLTVTITDAANGADKATWVVYVIRRAGTPVIVAGDNGGDAMAANITPLSGLEDGYLSILAVGVDCNTGGFTPSLAVPSGYNNPTEATPTASASVATLLAEAELDGSVTVPATVTYSTETAEQWVSFNIAIPPGVGEPPPEPETRRFYLANQPAYAAPGIASSWLTDTAALSNPHQLTESPAGDPDDYSQAETSSSTAQYVLMGQWTSTPAATAGILYSDWELCARWYESAEDADLAPFINVWVTVGSTSQKRGGADAISSFPGDYELPAGSNPGASNMWAGAGTGEAPMNVEVGDRVVIELGYQPGNSSPTSYSSTLYYGGTDSTDLGVGDTDEDRPAWVDLHLSEGLTFEEPPDVTTPPATEFDLSRWHLTTPAEDVGDGDAEQIDQPELDSYASEYFYLDDQNRMVFVAPVDGFTTSGESGATRSELREHEANYDNSAWDPSTVGLREMTLTTRSDARNVSGGTDPRQEIIIAQIHGETGTPPIYLAAEYDVSTPRVRVFGGDPDGFRANPVEGITPDTPITIRMRVEDARLKTWVVAGEVSDLPAEPLYDWAVSGFDDDQGWYFKAGAYNKTKIESGSTGEVTAKISYLELIQVDGPDHPPTTRFFLAC